MIDSDIATEAAEAADIAYPQRLARNSRFVRVEEDDRGNHRRQESRKPIQRIMSWTGHDSESLVIHYAKAQANLKEGVADFKSVTPAWGKMRKSHFSRCDQLNING